jgi:type I restriction enzyme S subunit
MMVGMPVPFTSAVTDATGGNVKIQRKDFLSEGLLPVIDQGQEDVAGYTNDLSHSYTGDLPVVLFGDHTRAFKYVDRPFALGADGVKVLSPRAGFNAKFLYYFFLSREIPSRGYSRHFKFLKELEIPLFAPREQSRIVELLDEADRLRRLRREADAKAARILPALFLKMFGDPATNPMGWPMKPLGDLLSDAEIFVDGDWVESKDQDPDGEVRLIQLADIGDGFYIDKSSRFLTKETALRLRCTFLIPGDVLVARMPDPLGRACIFPGDEKEAVTVVDVCVIRPGVDGPDPYWLMHCINSAGFRALIAQQQTGTTRARISRGNLSRLPIICPPPPLQRKFSVLSKQATEALSTAGAARKIEQLFELLLQRAFSGQLTAKWREAHMKELLVEMEQQARLLNLPLPIAHEALA